MFQTFHQKFPGKKSWFGLQVGKKFWFGLQVLFFRKAIEDMAAGSLRCVAIAYRPYEMENVPTDEEQLDQWVLPEDDLVLLAIVGIKVI